MVEVKNANFPLYDDGRTYHVGVKKSEVANNIITVGEHGRAELIARWLDPSPALIRVHSKRGYLTITGAYKGVPVSIIAIGMGTPMMDFFVREVRAVVDGPIKIIRFGSCGSITSRAAVGQIAVAAEGSIMVSRNYDYFTGQQGKPYNFSLPVTPCAELSKTLVSKFQHHVGAENVVCGLNVTADSFYSSQGRIDSNFNDQNATLIDDILVAHPNAITLEMESFTLMHLAKSTSPTRPDLKISAAAATMIFAGRKSGDFITAEVTHKMEELGGKACLDAVIA
ncbi:hypothetical protein HDV05_003130 [Chytridiales sp. JEL 0842]|nr:hypothetical protein HDV05_003130 [Chytridiales sp. JEL 0842]